LAAKEKKARGRPKKEAKVYPLHVLPGQTNGERLQFLYTDWYNCQRCELAHERRGPDITFAIGNPNAKIMIIGEAPGEEEERTSIPFVGPAGQLLNQLLAATSDDEGIQDLWKWYCKIRHSQDNTKYFHEKLLEWREREFFITNIVACRPPENRTPIKPEIEACWERVYNMIYTIDPWIILTLGKTAIEAVLKKTVEITQKRGQIYDIHLPGRLVDTTYPAFALLHPSFLLRVADWGVQNGFYSKTVGDLRQAMQTYDQLRNKYTGAPMPKRLGTEG
jgi:uracil-DNA glycosylase